MVPMCAAAIGGGRATSRSSQAKVLRSDDGAENGVKLRNLDRALWQWSKGRHKLTHR